MAGRKSFFPRQRNNIGSKKSWQMNTSYLQIVIIKAVMSFQMDIWEYRLTLLPRALSVCHEGIRKKQSNTIVESTTLAARYTTIDQALFNLHREIFGILSMYKMHTYCIIQTNTYLLYVSYKMNSENHKSYLSFDIYNFLYVQFLEIYYQHF